MGVSWTVTLNPCSGRKADGGTRTPDPIITSDVLYQLSYVGARLVPKVDESTPSALRWYRR